MWCCATRSYMDHIAAALRAALYKFQLSSFGREKINKINGLDK